MRDKPVGSEQKTKSLRPFDSRPSASSAPSGSMAGSKGGGYLGKKIKAGKGSGSLGFGKKKGAGQSGMEV